MYATYFLIGFATSFGWWSAGKIQKAVDSNPIVAVTPQTVDVSGKTKPENIDKPLANN